MQLTKFDRWLREKFIYQTHIYTMRLPESALPAQVLISFAPLPPAGYLGAQTSLGMLQCVLLHLHDHKLKVTGDAIHPLAGVPDALEALRLKASRKRLVDHYQASMPAIVKIQALGRKRMQRASTKMLHATKKLG